MLCLAALLACSCSTQKNTAASRAFHSMKVKYNIYHNGNIAYQEGLQATAQAHTDDYSDVLPLYPVSDHKAAEASKAKMERTIEKCRKCIKLHSIKKKPKPNPKKSRDPKYKAWLQQEEFNPSMPLAWLRLGQAEFQQGDFLGSVSTFAYIQRHFNYDKDLIAQCQLWQVRAYAEMGWLYEAEDLLLKVHIDELSRKHASLYSAVAADLYLKQKRYNEAIPQIKLAKHDEPRKTTRPRFEYVLGQLYELAGNRDEALGAYKRVLKLTPEWTMDFNARLRITQLQKNANVALKDLDKMIGRDKYKDYLDQLYGAKGNIYLQHGDTAAALEQFALAAEKSTRNGAEKAAILVKAGDICFDGQNYAQAQPYYAEATTLLSAETDEYQRVKKRSEVLDELVMHITTVTLQDSLQRLSTLSEEEQMRVAEKIIADLIEQERQDSIAAAQREREAMNDAGPRSVNTANMLGGAGGSTEWYFYNANLIKQGKQAFRQRWGTRQLEDNWRRMIKSAAVTEEPEPDNADEQPEERYDEDGNLITDESASQPAAPAVVTDNKDPQFYLQQIPRTPEQLQQSDTLIADALYNEVLIYQDKLEDDTLAMQVFAELERRFPHDKRLLELYYMTYLQALKRGDDAAASVARTRIITDYPDSRYAKVVSDPDYFARLQASQAEVDTLYERTWGDYKQGRYAEVKHAAAVAQEQHPLSPLVPRFLFLKAVAVAKTDGKDAFADALRDLVSQYPESEMSSMAKDMLSMMNQGMENQRGGATTSLAEKREQQLEQEQQELAEQTEQVPEENSVVITMPAEADNNGLNRLLYEVALFNFSQFMIKDFDLEPVPAWQSGRSALKVTGFDSPDETEWYKGLLRNNNDLMLTLTTLGATIE
ncbi:MAG: tetratricopeptide repeat protein [Paludibacteraceae bacterium]|nr:tetratricopeptide repeat protein [Paludibacteraceae bacterium]